MNTRRQFLATAPLGIAGVIAACSDGARGTAGAATPAESASGTVSPSGVAPAKSVMTIPADAPTLNWIPKHEELRLHLRRRGAEQRIQPGTRIITWTEDCFDGTVKTAADLPSKVMPPGPRQPADRPVLCRRRGARRHARHSHRQARAGAALCCVVLRAGLRRARRQRSNRDARPRLSRRRPGATTSTPSGTSRARSSRDGKLAWEVPLAPFLGCLGVAPAGGEVRTTIVPGNFGGNMDCPEVRAGNTVYLGVNVPGGLVSFGDGHYAMGDGEIMGAAIEGAMNVEVYVDLIKRKHDADSAHRECRRGHVRRLRPPARRCGARRVQGRCRLGPRQSGMGELDAYQFVSQNAKAPIIQIVDPEYTVIVKIEKMRVPGARG